MRIVHVRPTDEEHERQLMKSAGDLNRRAAALIRRNDEILRKAQRLIGSLGARDRQR